MPAQTSARTKRPAPYAVREGISQEIHELLGMLSDQVTGLAAADLRGNDQARAVLCIARDELRSLVDDIRTAKATAARRA